MKIKSNDNLNLDDLLHSISKSNKKEENENDNLKSIPKNTIDEELLIEKKKKFQEEKIRIQREQEQSRIKTQKNKINIDKNTPKEPPKVQINKSPTTVQTKPVEKNIKKNNAINQEDKANYRNSGMLVTASFKFAKDQYTRTFALLIMMAVITLIVVFQTYNIATYKAPVKYIPIYEDKTIIDPVPLNKPVMSDDQMKQWLADAVSDIFSYNYLNLDKHGEKISGLFTETGYATFKRAFDSSADVARVKGQSLIVVSNVVGSPVKAFSGYKVSGPYAYWDWKFQLRQAFVSPNNRFIPVTYDVVVTIIRQDQKNYRSGIAIHSLRIEGSSELQGNSSK